MSKIKVDFMPYYYQLYVSVYIIDAVLIYGTMSIVYMDYYNNSED